MTVIAGRRPILEALRAGTAIERIIIRIGAGGEPVEEIRSIASERHIRLEEADRDRMRALADGVNDQGVIALVAARPAATLEAVLAIPAERSEKGFVLVLDEIEDPQNLGALIRTAECAGVHGVIIPRHRSAGLTDAVTRASAGATEHMAVAQVTNLVTAIERMKEEGFWAVGLDASAGKSFTAVDYTTPVALVIGSEGKGLRRLVREHCDHLVSIPLRGRVGSLNASVAGALAMYEVVRARTPVSVTPGPRRPG